ncbi:MAG: sigma-70 family RNA polymerase sigma factor [bacterium]|nr:sigma-70 family RNA polymerase sigma factor [bacterium]
MQRIAGGDAGAFAALAERYTPRLHVVARRLLPTAADAEDAVQLALVRCWTAAGSYRPEWAVSTWLYRILANVCIDELRRAARTARTAAALPAGGVAAAADAGALDVDRALARVPREARVLLALRYVDGLSHAELARVRGISVNTVKSQLARGKRILHAALGEEDRHASVRRRG